MAALRVRGDSPGLRLLGLERRDRADRAPPRHAARDRGGRALAGAQDRSPRAPPRRRAHEPRSRGPRRSRRGTTRCASSETEHAADPDAFRRAARELAPVTVVSWRILGVHLLISALLRRALAPLRRRVAGDPVTVVIG